MIDIVCIDDEPQILRVESLLLRASGFSVEVFEYPEEAVEFINQNEVGLILCDYRMPAMNGLDVLRAIAQTIPFYLVSGDLEVDAVVAAEPRLSGVLMKPVPASKLVELAKSVLGASHNAASSAPH